MNLAQLFHILHARYKVAFVVALLTVTVAIVGSKLAPRQYTAEVAVMVDIRSPDPVSSVLLPATMMPGSLGTQVDIINSDRVAHKVVKILRLDEMSESKDRWHETTGGRGKLADWLASAVQKSIKVTASRDSNLINIVCVGSDPTFVTAVANAYAQAYIEASIELKVEPARQYARWFGDQAKILRENLEKAQTSLSDYQRQKGIVVTDENLDSETVKLNELSARLTAVQAETRDAQSKQHSPSGTTDVLPEVLGNPVVSGLRTSVAQLEAKLKDAAGNIGSKHPQYQRMESELAELKARLEAETRYVTSGYTASSAVGKAREGELKIAIEAQKKKLLDLKKERDGISVLLREVETAKRAYEAVNNRFNQTSLESQATQTNVSVLTPAVEPLEPSFPKPLQTTLLASIVLGIFLGGVTAFGLEMLDQRVRSVQDLGEMLQLPVIGVLERSGKPGRLTFWRRSNALVVR